jgi:hypothetical protein
LLRQGVDWEVFDAAQLVNVIYSFLVENLVTYETSRQEARETIEKRLADIVLRIDAGRGKKIEAEPFRLSPQMARSMGIRLPKSAAEAKQ